MNDIRVIIEKKMVSKGGIQHLGSYVASFDDVVGDQDENDDRDDQGEHDDQYGHDDHDDY